jgi:hypothetical protein
MLATMDITIELGVLLLIQLIGSSMFAVFEVETPAWRKILKWVLLDVITIGLSIWIGHWSLIFPILILTVGATYHFWFCKNNGIDPLKATPRKKYYALRKWTWLE